MYFLNKPIIIIDPGKDDDFKSEHQSYVQIQSRCDSLGKMEWNQKEYNSILNAISTNSSGSATISQEQADGLKNSLEKNYASSMLISFKNWSDNLGTTDIQTIFAEMLTQSNKTGCKYLLERPITVIKNYNLALAVPASVQNFKNNKFDIYN